MHRAWGFDGAIAGRSGANRLVREPAVKYKALPAVWVLLAGLLHPVLVFADQALSASDNSFAFKLFRQLAGDQPDSNISISPYSVATVLQMVQNGAAGTTRAEMQQVLATSGLSSAAVNAANKEIAQSLGSGNANVTLTIANAIWYRSDTAVNPAFFAETQQFYDAQVDALDFADPHAVDVINGWASDKTHGKIPRIADRMIDPVNTRLFLADAVYFKGKWSSPFAQKDTKERPFYLRGGGQKKIPMMTQRRTLAYRQGPGYQAVRLPYAGENLAMYIFLPDTDSGPQRILELLGGDAWERAIKPGFAFEEGSIVLPKFKIEYGVELRQPLRALGMKAAFDASIADFSGIAPRFFISAARHKTFVEVNEEGTEAAAVTGVGMSLTALKQPSKPFKMIVERPFLFIIEDRRSGTILFMGVVFDPQIK
jgi:serine protease inhibitor